MRHSLQVHSRHGHRCLCPFKSLTMPWFRHLVHFGVLPLPLSPAAFLISVPISLWDWANLSELHGLNSFLQDLASYEKFKAKHPGYRLSKWYVFAVLWVNTYKYIYIYGQRTKKIIPPLVKRKKGLCFEARKELNIYNWSVYGCLFAILHSCQLQTS